MSKIVNFFFKMMLILMVCGVSLSFDMNGFLSLVIMILLIFLIIKLSLNVSLPLLGITFFIYIYKKVGLTESFFKVCGLVIVLFLIIGYVSHRNNVDRKITDARKQGRKACPRCGSTNIQYIQGYANTHTERKYYRDNTYENVIKTDYVDGYWKCLSCEKQFK